MSLPVRSWFRVPVTRLAFPPFTLLQRFLFRPLGGGGGGGSRVRSIATSCVQRYAHHRDDATTFVSSHFRGDERDVLDYLDRKGFQYRVTGTEINVKQCPFCPPHKNRLDNMWKVYFNRLTTLYFCHRCGHKGSLFDFKRQLEDGTGSTASFVESIAPRTPRVPDVGAVESYSKALDSFPDVLHYLVQKRGLSVEVLRKYGVGAATFQFCDEKGQWKEHLCVTFPWIEMDQDGGSQRTIRIKARALDHKSFQKLDPPGGAWGLFGWHTIRENAKEVVLTEGEYDAMAVHQATGMPCVSLPNGCRSLPIELLPKLERFEKIYLWMDDDLPGRQGAEVFANKLGIERCHLVYTKGGEATGPKDANEVLLREQDMIGLLEAAAPIPHEQILSFQELRDEVKREFSNPLQVAGIQSTTFPSLNKILKGHRRGELTIISGPTGVGKTTVLSQLSLDYCQQGVTTLWGSFEIKNVRLAKKMLQQYSSRNLEGCLQDFDVIADSFSQLPLHFLRFFGSTDVDQVLDAMDYAVYVHDVGHIVLDNLQFMVSGQGIGFERFDIQDRAVEKFRRFASTKNVHVTLVIHPRKEDDDVMLQTSSVFGTAKATQEADNVIILQKGRAFRYLDVRKNRFDGDVGVVPYRFDRKTHRFYELTDREVKGLVERDQAVNAMGNGGGGTRGMRPK